MNIIELEIIHWVITVIIAIITIYQNYIIQNLKHKQSKAIFVHQLQFEKEFEIYKELWVSLLKLQEYLSVFEYDNLEYKERIIQKHLELFENCWDIYNKNKPFYPEEVFIEVDKLLMYNNLLKQNFEQGLYGSYGNEIVDNITNSEKAMEKVCQAIRNRVFSLEEGRNNY